MKRLTNQAVEGELITSNEWEGHEKAKKIEKNKEYLESVVSPRAHQEQLQAAMQAQQGQINAIRQGIANRAYRDGTSGLRGSAGFLGGLGLGGIFGRTS